MQEAEIDFGNGRDGIVPVGTYLIDAAKRMGAIDHVDCVDGDEHLCEIRVTQGAQLLSRPASDERSRLTDNDRSLGTRLGCYARIDKPGVITAMVEKKKEEPSEEKVQQDREQAYRKEFADLPLEKKIANLMQLEAIALGETFAFVVNSPFKVFEKIGDVMAEFGFRKEEDQKKRSRPAESVNGTNGSGTDEKSASADESAKEQQEV